MAEERTRLLLIEHDEAFARYVAEMLGQARNLPVELWVADDLGTGLEALLAEPFDAVLIDLCVPDGAGLGNLALIQGLVPNLPIVVAGDMDDELVAVEAMHAGAQDYLVKGQLTPGWLERAVRYAIERQRMEAALLLANEKYHSIFDHLVEGIFQTTPEGCYLMANTALARIYGYNSPAELIETLTNIAQSLYVQPGRRDDFVRLMQEHDTLSGFESQVYRKDGSVIWISENCRAIRDPDGQLLYFEGTVEDITLRLAAEEKVRHSEALYHSLVETLPQNIFRKDLLGRFTFANQQFCRNLGRSLDEIVGQTDADFFPADLAAKYQRDDQRVLTNRKPFEIVEEHQPPGGEKLYVHVVKTPLYDADGAVIGLQGIFWDITREKLAEERIRRVNQLLAASRTELRLKHQEMEQDLRMARDVQLAMLPRQYPLFGGAKEEPASAFRFAHRYLPTSTVGGDFFTVFPISPDEAGVLICDVAGHGVRAGLVTAMIRPLVGQLRPLATDPGQFLTRINHDLHAMLTQEGAPAMLTTAFYLVADCRTGKLRYANAGHPKPLLLSRTRGRVEPLVNTSGRSQFPLGLEIDTTYQTSETQIVAGDLVMLFTDGLYEVQNRQGGFYSQSRLAADLAGLLNLAPAELLDQILAEVRRFSNGLGFIDDVCIVGMKFAGPTSGLPVPQDRAR